MAGDVPVRIERLAAGGDGVGRLADGRVVFVPLTAPGDLARIAVEEEHRRWTRARLVALDERGPARVEPRCVHFGECGGCAWQHLDAATQLDAKRSIVLDALRRLGRIEPPAEVRLVPSPQPYGYRSRARLRVQGGRVGYRRRRSAELCAIEHCPVLLPELEARLAGIEPGADGEIELFVARLRVGADAIRVSHGVFAQANAFLVGALAEATARAAGRGALALELFAGAGTLTLPLARGFERVEAVEASARAARELRANLAEARCSNVAVVVEAVEAALAKRADAGPPPDCVVLDPPRSGLPAAALAPLAGLGASRLVYVSCDPATLARDLASLRELAPGAWRIERLEIFDLFPQTPHVETLALLERA